MRYILHPPEDCSSGDVIIFSPTNLVGTIVSLMTRPWWPFSLRYVHVGIIIQEGDGPLLLVESTRDPSLGPCYWSGTHVSGVQAHPLDRRLEIHRKRGGKAWRFPLRGELTTGGRMDLYLAARSIRCTGYDILGALRAGDGLTSRLLRWLVKADEDFLYCNEAVAVILKRARVLRASFNAGRYNPKSFAAELIRLGVTHEPVALVG